MATRKGLPGLVVARVIAIAAQAINEVEGDTTRERAREAARLRSIRKDRASASAAIEDLNRLTSLYLPHPDVLVVTAHLAAMDQQLTRWIDDEAETWLQPNGRGRRQREDHESLAVQVLGLVGEGWSIREAAGAVAGLVDQTWRADPRVKTKRLYAVALFGSSTITANESRAERVARLAEVIRKRAHALTSHAVS